MALEIEVESGQLIRFTSYIVTRESQIVRFNHSQEHFDAQTANRRTNIIERIQFLYCEFNL